MITLFYTCKRHPSYIGETLNSYFDHFTDVPFVSEQEGTMPYINRTRVIPISNVAHSCVTHWMAAAKWLYDNTKDDLYMICEDDIVFRENFKLPKINQKVGFISAYCAMMNRPVHLDMKPGWYKPRIGKTGWCGSLCLILPHYSLERIAKNMELFYEGSLGGGIHLDTAIGTFFKNDNNFVHWPTMVLHQGDVSTYAANNLPQHIDHPARQPAL